MYWYALKSTSHQTPDYALDQLEEYFEAYHPLIQEIIRATPQQNIHTAEILDLSPIKKWYQHQVCLLGDAAHATTPNMGQGACQAIEDAYVLSECLAKYTIDQAFEKYQKLRLSKAHQVVKTSWTLGKLAHWKSPLAISFRNQLMRLTPQKISRQQSEKIFQLASI